MRFIKEMVKNFKRIWSVHPSSPYLVDEMVASIPKKEWLHIIEFGAGTWVITRELIKKCGTQWQLWSFEMQDGFLPELQKLATDNVHVIHANALDFVKYIGDQRIDYIVSGLPLALIDTQTKEQLLGQCAQVLGNHGHYIQFQYSLNAKQLLESYFRTTTITTVVRNIPPAFVYRCNNIEKNTP